MQRAGAAAAAEIAFRCREELEDGVLVLAGPGNNGGDAWVVARALATTGARVQVLEPVEAKTADAIAERALALDVLGPSNVRTGALPGAFDAGASLVVDGLLGTGGRGVPTGLIAQCIDGARAMRARGAIVVALDVPSGMDASTGRMEDVALDADLTLTFGTAKRGHLVARDRCGAIVVLDIGLGTHASLDDGAPELVDDAFLAHHLPPIRAAAHKGDRKKLAIVGGHEGFAGAMILTARGALRSGVGMVKAVVARETLPVIQEAEPHALAAMWPADDASFDRDVGQWADAVVVGPGLGRDDSSREMLERLLRSWRGPTVIDADALTLFEGQAERLASLLGGRPALITPHPVEFSRLSGMPPADVLANRFDAGLALAKTLGAAVLLKGVPTVISSPDGRRLVSATGTPALGTGGSGDVLSGMAGTLLAQTGDPFVAAGIAAYVHGRAAERVPVSHGVRGIALEDVVAELRDAWGFDVRPGRYPVLAELSAIVT